MLPNDFVSAGIEFSTYEKPVSAPLFKKSFFVDGGEEKCHAVIGCTGFYELVLNGERVTDGFLAPFTSNSDRTVFYREYDFSCKLKKGQNTLYVLLGNGFANPIGGEIWHLDRRDKRGAPAFALDFCAGEMHFSAGDMEWCASPLLFDDYRIGTLYDAREEARIKAGEVLWSKPFAAESPRGEKRLVTSEPIREIRRIKPVKIRPGELRDYRIRDVFAGKLHTQCAALPPVEKCGGYIYDFGENVSGVPVLSIKGEAGQRIDLQFSELLFEGFADYINVDVYPDGACQRDTYICRGGQPETYIPPFTYHGARYCYVHGVTSEQAQNLLEFAVIRNDVETRSDFLCSDDISNEIFRVCRRSDQSNLHHILTDCPTREKNGWTGDAAISADHFLMGYAAESCFADWLASIRDFQDNNGGIPCVIPCGHGLSDSVVWDSILFFLPYYCYKYGGRTDIVSRNAAAMMKNLKYHLSFRDERGIVDRGMGDWLPVNKGAYESASPLGFCCTAVMAEMCRMGEIMLGAAGFSDYARFCKATREELVGALRNEYIDGVTVGAGRTQKYVKPQYKPCQTSQALGVFFGIFSEEEKQGAVEKLVELIGENGGSFDCGFLGLRAIFHVLSQYGYTSLAYKMITKPTHPSFANMIYRGETTVWERFCPPGERTGSHNHHFMAEPSLWYMQYVAGIRVNPCEYDRNEILIEPAFPEEIENVKAHYQNGEGRVDVCINKLSDGKNVVDIDVRGKLCVRVSEKIKNNKNVIVKLSEKERA